VISTSSFDLQPFDTDMSVRIKRELVERDLLSEALRHLVVSPNDQFPEYRSAQISASVPNLPLAHYSPRRGRPLWNLFFRTLLFMPILLVRNWYRRAVGRFPVIILYHHLIADRSHHFAMPTSQFIKHVRFLKQYYSVCSLSEALLKLQGGYVTSPTVVLTFDDGYRDNYLTLRAVAEEFAIPVCLFLCTDHLTSGRPFDHDLRRGQEDFFPLTWEQVGYLRRGGFEIGSHTRTHFDCGSCNERLLHEEIVVSRQELERQLGEPVKMFSFPWGHPDNISPMAMRLAQETYAHVFSAYGGQNFPDGGQPMKHLRRPSHPADLWELELVWELELAIQSVLDL
jgi:peptidoglycan/xylan/chitin deacetylase (PgdA/CDA1 family)